MQHWPTRLPDLILIVSIYVFIHTTRHPTATIFVPRCNFLCGASASFASMASTPPGAYALSRGENVRFHNLPAYATTQFSPLVTGLMLFYL
jgi:hypothetical protein